MGRPFILRESANPRGITKSVQARKASGRDRLVESKFRISKICYRPPALRVLSHLFITWGSRTHPRLLLVLPASQALGNINCSVVGWSDLVIIILTGSRMSSLMDYEGFSF